MLSGPLFLVYVNGLCNGNFKGNLVSFADDTALFYKADTILDLRDKIQSDINVLKMWFLQNFMVMSPKTKFLAFSPRKKIVFDLPIKIMPFHVRKTCVLVH